MVIELAACMTFMIYGATQQWHLERASRFNPLRDLTELRFWEVYVVREQDAMNISGDSCI